MIAVAAGVVCREGRIMICQRKPGGHQPLKWEFPGGKLEAGESPEQALARELREELGIEVRVGRILDAQRIADDGRDLLVLFYLAEIASGEPEPLDCNAVAWAESLGCSLRSGRIRPRGRPAHEPAAERGAPSAGLRP